MIMILSLLAACVFSCQLWILFCTVRFYVKRIMLAWHVKSKASDVHCMCGYRVDSHSFGSGHSPVSEFDYGMASIERMRIES